MAVNGHITEKWILNALSFHIVKKIKAKREQQQQQHAHRNLAGLGKECEEQQYERRKNTIPMNAA